MAKELGISRSPIKTAFDRLINDGLLIKKNNKSPYVSSVESKDCLLICQARMCIEGYAAYIAAKQITPNELIQLEKLNHEYKRAAEKKDCFSIIQCDHSFHNTIVKASHNSYLIEMYKCIESRIIRYRFYLEHIIGTDALLEILVNQAKYHQAILNALKMLYRTFHAMRSSWM